jgi:hypothetical protein
MTFYGKEILHFCGYWQTILFVKLWSTPILVDDDTDCVGKIISLSLHAYKEHPNQRSYVFYALI